MMVSNLASVVKKTTKGIEWAKQLIWEYQDVFPIDLPSGMPIDRGASFQIEILLRTKSANWPIYYLTLQELEELWKILDKIIENGFIWKSTSL